MIYNKGLRFAKKIIAKLLSFGNDNNVKEAELPYIKKQANINVFNSITHLSAFSYGNAGDTLLPIALHDSWGRINPTVFWENLNVRNEVNEPMVNRINTGKGLVIGGGGLFLKDTNTNKISGWQWPCSIEMLHKINVPLVLFAVGYNRFRGQEEFEPYFKDNIIALAEKAFYLGIRNSGSILALKNYIPAGLHDKLRFQPCMTTLISRIYPELTDYSTKEDFIAFNAAFDRSHFRFGESIGNILSGTARALKKLSNFYPIKFYIHVPSDEAILPFFQSFGVPYEIVRLNNVHPSKIIEAYARPRLAVGMRGHAQMIPFGCNTPIFSIVSHNKLQWFLDDIHKPDWGADVTDPDFENKLYVGCMHILNNYDQAVSGIVGKQSEFLAVTDTNVRDALHAMNIV